LKWKINLTILMNRIIKLRIPEQHYMETWRDISLCNSGTWKVVCLTV
jgi:hypothetical protein